MNRKGALRGASFVPQAPNVEGRTSMNLVFLGDTEHEKLQTEQIRVLQERELAPTVIRWTPGDMTLFSELDQLASPITMIASRHGSIPATSWTSRNPTRVRRLILLHPSLHLGLPYQPLPAPHFVPTMVVVNSKEFHPSADQLSSLVGKFFHDYALHITPESAELKDTLSLLSL